MSDVTHILNAMEKGNAQAASQLLPLVYDELRRLAAHQLAHEQPGQTLDATGLVHEAYLRLAGGDDAQSFVNRRHFFGAAAEAMRRILIDSARRKQAEKRGGNLLRQDLDPEQFPAPQQHDDILALDEALQKLATTEPEVAELVRLRYYAGLSIPKTAALLGVAPRTADAWWAFARAWLLNELRDLPG
jgi:RNA polymerase sigma factor (TIGR02999 family)